MDRALARRPSIGRKVSKGEEDRKAMPPPMRRPASARPPPNALFRPPPPSTPVRRPTYDDEDDPDHALFNDTSPFMPVGSYGHPSPLNTAPIPFPPRQPFGADVGFDAPDYPGDMGGRYRRNSYYGPQSTASGDGYVDKFNQARRYQEDVAGPQLPLTAETLRKAGRNTESSRSTRSSGSHDESEYRQSATTRTTRSTANEENFTIKVRGGGTTLKFGGAEMRCEEGAEINITSGAGGAEIRTNASDRSSYIDQDDRRTRIDIPAGRSRAKSRARSFSRHVARYEPSAEYDVYPTYGTSPMPPPYPAYPAYPSSFGSRPEDGYFGRPV